MVDGDEVALGPYEHIVAYLYASAPEKCAALLDEASLADGHWFSIVDVERRQHGGGLIEGLVKDTTHELMHFLRSTVASVHLCRGLHRVENVSYKKFISGVVGRNHLASNVSVKNFVSHIVCHNTLIYKCKITIKL